MSRLVRESTTESFLNLQPADDRDILGHAGRPPSTLLDLATEGWLGGRLERRVQNIGAGHTSAARRIGSRTRHLVIFES